MYAFAGFAYVGAIIAFAVIFASESNKSTTETVISASDSSGQDGYTCQMISKVNAEYEVSSTGGQDPSQAFQLVNVIESKTQYEEAYAISDPCSKHLEYFPGTIKDNFLGVNVQFGAGVFYGEGAVYYVATNNVGPKLMYLNVTFGISYPYLFDFPVLVDSLAVDVDGSPLLISTAGARNYEIYRFTPDRVSYDYTYSMVYTVTLSNQPIILNDNLYNSYLAEHDTFTALDVYSSPASNTTLFTTRDGEFIRYAAVYNSGSSVKVYYVNNTDGANVWEGGVFTELGGHGKCAGIAVDGSDSLYFLIDVEDQLLLKNATGTDISFVTTSSTASGIAVTPRSARAIVLETDRGIDFVYDPLDPHIVHVPELLRARQGFSVGYFTCGSVVLNTTVYDTTDSAEYSTVCEENGVVGQVIFETLYYFTNSDVQSYAYLHGPSHCAALADPIAQTIADLPPYSCSRTIHPSFLACFATAAANTQLLFQVLVFVSALALSKLAARYPPKQSLRSEAAPHATPYAVELTSMDKTKQDHDVENPMTR